MCLCVCVRVCVRERERESMFENMCSVVVCSGTNAVRVWVSLVHIFAGCAWMEVRCGALGALERARAMGVRSETAGVGVSIALHAAPRAQCV